MFHTAEIPLSRIVKRVTVADPKDQYRARSATAKTPAERAALAAWARENGLNAEALDQAQAALKAEPANAAAQAVMAALGWIEKDGAWVLESEWLAKNGMVKRDGKVMTKADAEEADRKAAAAKADAEAKDRAALLASTDRELAGLEARKTQRTAQLDQARQALAKVQTVADGVTQAKAAVQEAQKELDRITDENMRRQRDNEKVDEGAAKKAYEALVKAQKAYNAAKATGGAAAAQAAQLQAQINGLTAEIAGIDNTRATLEKRKASLSAPAK